ncbi:DUF802 domain-containing protein [Dyella sp.]|jgi:hypothetical protein|uniref:DUF802 domain-containing protein n=1 Tax=Dyella sp. TaxID=1869338 RepID=UPI002D793351|nr:DUF802 domain-containing protein [Dyella sp.]HET6433885.1 DUF802 domain-containing protein [Dyella sp.]
MSKNLLLAAVFALGLAAVGWIVIGYLGSNPLGLAVALLIGACYLAGAAELFRYHRATASLQQAVNDLADTPPELGAWLQRLHPGLRHAVRLRVEGERVALPAPAMTPYLVGLLVLLGMLGTLLGMMATLRGTGIALQSATDIDAIRGSLAAPVNGLGFAFGTSIAGVAGSAMLGLLSALVRRERLQAVQSLDAKSASSLRIHSQAHQREESFRLLQRQTEAMPLLVDRLQGMIAALEQHGVAAGERQHASQQAFHRSTEDTFQRLADSVGQSLKDSVAQSVRASAGALQPVVESTMASVARETAAMQAALTQAVQQQLQGLSAGFDTTAATVTGIWNEALVEQRRTHEAHAQELGRALQRFTDTFEQRAATLLDGVAARLDSTVSSAAETLAGHRQTSDAHARELGHTLQRFADSFEQRSSGLLDGVAARLDAAAARAGDAWSAALSNQHAVNADLASANQQALAAASEAFQAHAEALVQAVDRSHGELQSALEARDEQRLAAWAEKLEALTAELGSQWQVSGEQTARRQQAICDTLEKTAIDISAQTQAHASATLAEIARLVEAAAEAPRAAAEVVGELRQKLSDSMVRDTAMLEERSRLLATLETLLDAVNHASTEQRSAVDALVSTSADLLDRVGSRFAEQIEAQTGRLDGAAAQVTASAVEVASLGEAFGAGVAQFGQANDALMERLQQIATALDGSLARSDEQLAYYVAQAREVVELSVLSQQQILADLQQSAGRRAPGKAAKA